MEITEFVFKLLLLFFPGIICAYLVDQLTIHRPREPFFFLLQSFTFGLASYFLYWAGAKIAGHCCPTLVNPHLAFLRTLTDSTAVFSFREIAYVSIVATILACMISVASRFKLLNRIAKWVGLTKKFGELDVWGYLLNMEQVAWVTVRDHKNDLVYDGWVQAFSDDSKDAELLLRDVTIYKNKTGKPLYQIGALYLSRNREDITIECRTLPIDDQVKWKENANATTTATPTATTTATTTAN